MCPSIYSSCLSCMFDSCAGESVVDAEVEEVADLKAAMAEADAPGIWADGYDLD